MTARSFGITGSTDPALAARLAARLEQLGYRALWVNETPGGDALAVLAAAAGSTTTLGLATGVIPIDRTPGTEIARRVRELGLPLDRLRVGVGSGASRKPIGLVERGVAELREVDGLRVIVGALGPKMRALGGAIADGVLLNWLTPEAGAEASAALHAAAPGTETILYARTIGEAVARPALRAEAERYLTIPSYAVNFDLLGIDPVDTAIDLSDGRRVPHYGDLDELVLRAITATGSEGALLRLAETGAPGVPT